MSKHKKYGKNTRRVFFDIFSSSNHDPSVQFPQKNQVPVLENLLSFAVWHCIRGLEFRLTGFKVYRL